MTVPPRPAKRAFTGRAAVLAVVVLGLLLAIAYPLQDYLAQRGEIATLRAARDQSASTVDALAREAARWQDPAFVKQQAKERLYFVSPGEKTYVVIGAPTDQPSGGASAAAVKGRTAGTWYERIWSTVGSAGQGAGK